MRSLLLAGAALCLALAAAPVATAAPACSPHHVGGDGVGYDTDSGCAGTLTVTAFECTWGGHYDTHKVGTQTVRVYECDAPYPPPQ